MILAAAVGCATSPWWAPPLTLALFVVACIAGAAYCDARMGPPKRREE
jgi:hypothetical protein